MEKLLEILDLPDDVRRLAGECEITGQRTLFARNGRAVAVLMSHDEYLALKETLEISANPEVRSQIDTAEFDVRKNALLQVEDLIEGGRMKDEG